MEKAIQFQQALVEETGKVFPWGAIDELASEAEKKLAELRLKVEDWKVYAKGTRGTVHVEWSVGDTHFCETFELKVQVPMAKQGRLETHPLIERLRIIVATFRRFGYEVRIAVFPGPPGHPPERYLEILIAKQGEFEAFLSCSV